MKYILLPVVCLCFANCKEEPHLKHKIAFTKAAEECASGTWDYKLVSNTNGERYEFNACLSQDYSGTYKLERRGDTLDVKFPDPELAPTSLFKLVLDVDAFPKYSHIYLGTQLLKVGAK